MSKRVKFGRSKVQKLNRIALPGSLLDNLDIDVGGDVEFFLDVEKEEIIIRRGE